MVLCSLINGWRSDGLFSITYYKWTVHWGENVEVINVDETITSASSGILLLWSTAISSCGMILKPPEGKPECDVITYLLCRLHAIWTKTREKKKTPCKFWCQRHSCILEMSFGWGLIFFSTPPPLSLCLSPSLWKLKGQWRLIRMQRRKALLQIENILILLMLGGRGGERQRDRGGKRWGEWKAGDKKGMIKKRINQVMPWW